MTSYALALALALFFAHHPTTASLGWSMGAGDKRVFDFVIQRYLTGPLADQTPVYVEFGCGGSTARVLETTQAEVYSVDTSPVWLGAVGNATKTHAARFHPIHADIGNLMAWGRPARSVKPRKKHAYFTAANQLLPRANVVLVDGSYRVRVAIEVVRRVRPSTIVMIHDFWDRVHKYEPVLTYYDMLGFRGDELVQVQSAQQISSMERLVVLQPKTSLPPSTVDDYYLRTYSKVQS